VCSVVEVDAEGCRLLTEDDADGEGDVLLGSDLLGGSDGEDGFWAGREQVEDGGAVVPGGFGIEVEVAAEGDAWVFGRARVVVAVEGTDEAACGGEGSFTLGEPDGERPAAA